MHSGSANRLWFASKTVQQYIGLLSECVLPGSRQKVLPTTKTITFGIYHNFRPGEHFNSINCYMALNLKMVKFKLVSPIYSASTRASFDSGPITLCSIDDKYQRIIYLIDQVKTETYLSKRYMWYGFPTSEMFLWAAIFFNGDTISKVNFVDCKRYLLKCQICLVCKNEYVMLMMMHRMENKVDICLLPWFVCFGWFSFYQITNQTSDELLLLLFLFLFQLQREKDFVCILIRMSRTRFVNGINVFEWNSNGFFFHNVGASMWNTCTSGPGNTVVLHS